MPIPMSPRQSALVLQLFCAIVVALLCIQGTSAQVDPTTADAVVVDGPIKLYLVAAYGPGLVRPTTGPTLIARKLNQKKINCQLKAVPGVKARATGVSIASAVAPTLSPQAAPSVLSAAAQAAVAAPVARTACRGNLASGRYNLLASYLEGATFPQWNCYAAAPGDAAAAAALDPALSLPMETQVSVHRDLLLGWGGEGSLGLRESCACAALSLDTCFSHTHALCMLPCKVCSLLMQQSQSHQCGQARAALCWSAESLGTAYNDTVCAPMSMHLTTQPACVTTPAYVSEVRLHPN
jgi:hypothetical protein